MKRIDAILYEERTSRDDEIDYPKTIKTGKLVVIGDQKNKRSNIFILIIFIFLGLIFTAGVVYSQLDSENRKNSDYLISIGAILIFLFSVITGTKEVLNRNKLEKLHYDLNMISKELIISSLIAIEWEPYLIKENYIRIITKYSMLTARQTITLVFLPDGKIYFNSIRYPQDYIRAARFETNYQILIQAIAKQIQSNSIDSF